MTDLRIWAARRKRRTPSGQRRGGLLGLVWLTLKLRNTEWDGGSIAAADRAGLTRTPDQALYSQRSQHENSTV
jgi:hypothetical protein